MKQCEICKAELDSGLVVHSECVDELRSSDLRILKNHIRLMSKAYRKRFSNWEIVQGLILWGTVTAGRTSSIAKCVELGIDPYGYEI